MANSMFSKRHYEAIEEVWREERDELLNASGYTAWCVLRDRLADLFEADNPVDGKGHGFNRTKFEEACER